MINFVKSCLFNWQFFDELFLKSFGSFDWITQTKNNYLVKTEL